MRPMLAIPLPLTLLFTTLTSAATSPTSTPFTLSNLYTKQPNGNPDGQTNFYTISFTLNSTNGDSPESGYCWASWGDNSYTSNNAYSDYVPTGTWIQCAHNASQIGDQTSEFAFQLYKPFGIGEFEVAVLQNYTETTNDTPTQLIATSAPYTITNSTSSSSALTCSIIPSENPSFQVHASGECSTPSNFTGYEIPVANTTSACTNTPSTLVSLSFPVQERTAYGDNVFVVGNITELGDWDVYNAVALSSEGYTDIDTLWSGGDVEVAAGTAFEYKYIQWSADGSLLWECGENRVGSEAYGTCGTQTVGNDPDYFRCGNH
ncbi:hypothetical protein LTR86_007715 [Recurvomyces mirabilis]|nr:hypothetical protein LTR86_007715 [Recurvomyces mirabilis]